jgi:hypothetical protein
MINPSHAISLDDVLRMFMKSLLTGTLVCTFSMILTTSRGETFRVPDAESPLP